VTSRLGRRGSELDLPNRARRAVERQSGQGGHDWDRAGEREGGTPADRRNQKTAGHERNQLGAVPQPVVRGERTAV
jgi:hypothetical protein